MNTIRTFISTYQGLPKSVYVIFLARFVTAVGSFVGPLLTLIMTDTIGLSAKDVGQLVSFSTILTGIVFLYGGHLADKMGRKKMMIIGNSLGACCILSCAIIPPSYAQAYMLILSGICYSLGGPAASALLADLSTPDNRKVVYSLSYLGVNLGLAFGAAAAGFLYAYSLPLLFTLDALTTFLSVMLIWQFIEEPPQLHEQVTNDKTNHDAPLSMAKLFAKRKHLLVFALIMIGIDFTYAQLNFLLPLHVSNVYGAIAGAKYFGMLSSTNSGVVILLTPILTSLIKDIKTMIAITFGACFYVIGFGTLGFIENFTFFMIAVILVTIGEIILTLNVPAYIMNQTPVTHRGRMSAVIDLIMGVGYGVAPVIIGNVLMMSSYQKTWHFISLITIICTVSLGIMAYLQEHRQSAHTKDVSN